MSGCPPKSGWHSAALRWMGVVSTPAFQLSFNQLAFNVKTLQEVFSVIDCIQTSSEKNW